MANHCIIPARGGSKGIENKNMKLLNGSPLIRYTINCAKESKLFESIIVSSDSNEILMEAKRSNVSVFKRSKITSGDNIHAVHAVIEVLQNYSIEYKDDDIIYMLLPTSPLRIPKDLTEVDKLIKAKQNSNLISVKKVNHFLNNIRYMEGNNLSYVFKDLESRNLQRQQQEAIYVVNGSIFTSSYKELLKHKSFHQENPLGFLMPHKRSLDINNLKDFDKADKLINHLKVQ